jgi:hypothetical protein
MEKIKDITKAILPEGHMIVEMVEPKKRMIITPDGADSPDIYGIVVSTHESVTDIKPGDLCIKIGGKMFGWDVKQQDGSTKQYVLIHRGVVQVAVSPDNFIDPDELVKTIRL